ncbi:unnamed protein product [Thlaspi arvense]|uniref:Ribonucleoside-diphosphate reductase n=1 Tax=Thlaspi arvense TaxID=13288 RepID=A0AAU9RYU0_THLAR|nr:unnamed protein product [Thlaspi arvense]
MHDRDFDYDYFGFKTLERLCLLKVDGKVVERPQHMLMRVAVGIHLDDIDSAIKTYHVMSQRLFTHAPPTLLYAGTPRPQLSSSFLTCIQDDSIEGIYDTLQKCAVISKSAGSVSVSVHNANGISNLLGVLNATARYADQGGGKTKRQCSGRAKERYTVQCHAKITHHHMCVVSKLYSFFANPMQEARDSLCTALWVPDLFMERLRSKGKWSLFCPNEAPGLADCWGMEFERLYTKYEREGKAKKVLQARDLFCHILKSQLETGMPYMLLKDICNRKSNQQNLGTIKSSSMCTGVIEYTSPTETAVCNLASIALSRFVMEKGVPFDSHPSKLVGSLRSKSRYFDFEKLAEVTATVTNDVDKIIDRNYYPVESAKTSNMRHRPISIGVQGLADAFILLGMPFDSPEAQQLNTDIFETIYYHALKASAELAARNGAYETYKGSPMSKGILQPDMWGVTPSNRWDWALLRDMISKTGVRNSLLVSLMPTALTSQILGNSECFEPYVSNIYSRKALPSKGFLSGEFILVNKHLLHDLTEMGLWTPKLKDKVTHGNGSISNVPEIPDDIKAIYRTAWEMKQRPMIDMAADRGCYIDQSQCLNLHLEEPGYLNLTILQFYAWIKGLKTGMHYLRSRATNYGQGSINK